MDTTLTVAVHSYWGSRSLSVHLGLCVTRFTIQTVSYRSGANGM